MSRETVSSLHSLNTEQKRAVRATDGPVLIIAGAGSGKTRVLVHRISHMLSMGISPKSILALTFTNKAAKEMSDRVHSELTSVHFEKQRELSISTFHSFGLSILQKSIDRLGYRKPFTIYNTNDQYELLRECNRDLFPKNEEPKYFRILQIFSKIKSKQIDWNSPNVDQHIKSLYEEYQNRLKLFGAVDFDDLIQLPIQLFVEFPEILQYYQRRYKFFMVDEFQDTSKQQYELIRIIARVSRNICVVGDDDQSIYAWRAAHIGNFQDFEKDFPEYQEIKLEQNYRSTATILNMANKLISHNKDRKEKELWTGGEEGSRVEYFQPEDEDAECEWVISQIRSRRIDNYLGYDDFAVLLRTHSLSRHIEEAFRSRNIPYKVSGGKSFYERSEIRDIIAYLRCISNHNDDLSMLRIINRPRRGLGKQSIEVLRSRTSKNGHLFNAMDEICREKEPNIGKKMLNDLGEFHSLLLKYRKLFLTAGSMSQTLRQLIDEIDYREQIIADTAKRNDIAEFRWKNIESFIDSLKQWENYPYNRGLSIFDFLNRISLSGKDPENTEGMVNLMTIHASKGMEFDTVFIIGLEKGIIPHDRSINSFEYTYNTLEEERRLLYVAITRAKRMLYISRCLQRKLHKGRVEMEPSPFFEEIPQQLLQEPQPETELAPEESRNYFAQIREQLSGNRKTE